MFHACLLLALRTDNGERTVRIAFKSFDVVEANNAVTATADVETELATNVVGGLVRVCYLAIQVRIIYPVAEAEVDIVGRNGRMGLVQFVTHPHANAALIVAAYAEVENNLRPLSPFYSTHSAYVGVD